jgi:glycosyltransferase involved in cell wall biosynthesis
MKVAVYDRFWPTAGGGEKVAAGIAEVLASDHDVTLLGHDELDLDALGERLQVDLSGVAVRVLELTPTCVEEAAEGFDLLVNASYTSSATCTAAHGLYYVHFPHPPLRDVGGLKGHVVRALRPLVRTPGLEVSEERGLHPEEAMGRLRIQWTTGDAHLVLHVPPGEDQHLHIDLARCVPTGEPVPVSIEVDGVEQASTVLLPRTSRFLGRTQRTTLVVRGPVDGRPIVVGLRSPSFVPLEALGTDDRRRLGVPLAGVQLGDAIRSRVVRWFPSLARRPESLTWLESYDHVVANSEYTARWIERFWGVRADVLNPPITMQAGGSKDPIILNVGRFFDAERGHSKKQLELVKAFRELCESGLAGWELHLVGGCGPEDRAYLERVRHAAGDLPVVLHVNASGAELRDLYSRAQVYWHASGLGEDPERHPDRFEHFGITTVEAMSAGAVPIVIGEAGQAEVVEHGRSGFHFHTLDELVALTTRVVGDDALRSRLSEAARRRAQRYSMEAFAARVRDLVR